MLKTFTFTTLQSNFQHGQVWPKTSNPVHWSPRNLQMSFQLSEGQNTLISHQIAFWRLSTSANFPNGPDMAKSSRKCQQTKLNLSVQRKPLSLRGKVPSGIVKSKYAICGTPSGIYPFTPPFAVDCIAQKLPLQLSTVVTGHIDGEIVSSIHESAHMYFCTTVHIVQQSCNMGHIDQYPNRSCQKNTLLQLHQRCKCRWIAKPSKLLTKSCIKIHPLSPTAMFWRCSHRMVHHRSLQPG